MILSNFVVMLVQVGNALVSLELFEVDCLPAGIILLKKYITFSHICESKKPLPVSRTYSIEMHHPKLVFAWI